MTRPVYASWPWWRRLAARIWPWSTLDRCPTDGIVHDFHVRSGGKGFPENFVKIRCHKCRKEFSI